jgi:hypothetical protein
VSRGHSLTRPFFFCFRTGFRPTKGGRLIRLVRRDMRIGQVLFPWESNPVFPGYALGRSSLPREPKQGLVRYSLLEEKTQKQKTYIKLHQHHHTGPPPHFYSFTFTILSHSLHYPKIRKPHILSKFGVFLLKRTAFQPLSNIMEG